MKGKLLSGLILVGIIMLYSTTAINGQQNLSGTYTLTSDQTTLTLTLAQSGSNVTGTLTSTSGTNFQFEGEVAEGVGTGVCKADNSYVYFEAFVSDNELTLGLIEPDQFNMPDYDKSQFLLFTKQTGQGSQQSQTGNLTGQLFGDKSPNQPNNNQGQETSNLSGKWIFQNQQGQVVLEFLSANQLSFAGETTQYQLKEGVIQAMGEYGWIDYPYTLNQGTLTINFPDGTQLPFTRTTSSATNQQAGGGGSTWQLKGVLCNWSGSSGSSSSYSNTRKLIFDGQGNYQFGREGSFSGDDGLAYSGDPNIEMGTYSVGESTVSLYNQEGQTYQFKIKIRENNGVITCIEYEGALYSTSLCE